MVLLCRLQAFVPGFHSSSLWLFSMHILIEDSNVEFSAELFEEGGHSVQVKVMGFQGQACEVDMVLISSHPDAEV